MTFNWAAELKVKSVYNLGSRRATALLLGSMKRPTQEPRSLLFPAMIKLLVLAIITLFEELATLLEGAGCYFFLECDFKPNLLSFMVF